MVSNNPLWPELPYKRWIATYETLHMWMQIVGKVKLALAPFVNEWWEVAFFVNARGITSGLIPYEDLAFQVDFDFIDHKVNILVSNGTSRTIEMTSRSVAEFYTIFMSSLEYLGIEVKINTAPTEVENTIHFDEDFIHKVYVPEDANRFWKILLQVNTIFEKYRSKFFGKSSPVQFYWGSFDINVTRFSGRLAEPKPEMNKIMRLSMDQEQFACGFWPGNNKLKEPAFYAYGYPAQQGLIQAQIKPASAYFNSDLGEFILPYDKVRDSASPEKEILGFMESLYESNARLADWDRHALERKLD